jgi:hypothetical protein
MGQERYSGVEVVELESTCEVKSSISIADLIIELRDETDCSENEQAASSHPKSRSPRNNEVREKLGS